MRSKSKSSNGFLRFLLLLVVIASIGGLVLVVAGAWHDSRLSPEEKAAKAAARATEKAEARLAEQVAKWIKENLADKNAELMNAGKAVEYEGAVWRVLRVRGLNSYGGPVINDFVGKFTEEGQMLQAMSLKNFHELQPILMGEKKAYVLAGLLGVEWAAAQR